MDAITLYATWPDLPRAEAAARALVERRLVACVNLIPGVVSIYRWEGALQHDAEVVMIAKTSGEKAGAARDALLEMHPYQLPCVTAFRIDSALANTNFLNWMKDQTH
ncbi:MAG: divalent-cation tolerance protein CutA [Pseudomonadota bacterium]